jgi:hypothetical protein
MSQFRIDHREAAKSTRHLQLPAVLTGTSATGVAPTGYPEADGAGASSTTQSDVSLPQVGDLVRGCTEHR